MPGSTADDPLLMFPATCSQEGLWFLDQLTPGTPTYNLAVLLRLTGRLDQPALERSINLVVQRHEPLRTVFTVVDGRLMQVVHPRSPIEIGVIDLASGDREQRMSEAYRRFVQEARRPCDLSTGPLIRVALARLEVDEHLLLLMIHHIVSDGWSMRIVLRELIAAYGANTTGQAAELPELPITYADFAVWQSEWLQPERLEEQLGYWRERLGGPLPILEMPTSKQRPPTPTYQGATQRRKLPHQLVEALTALSRDEGVTLFTTLLTAFLALLYRYTGQQDILLGTPSAGRMRIELEGLVGFFVNTLVIRADLTGNPSFRNLLRQTSRAVIGAFDHQSVPFEKLVEALQPDRDVSRMPIFQVAFSMTEGLDAESLPGLTITPLPIDINVSRFDLSLAIEQTADQLVAGVEYSTDLFEAGAIERLLGHYQTLLEGIVANPGSRVSALPLLTEPERQQILEVWNNTRQSYSPDVCIHQLIAAQVQQTPDAVALVFEDITLTYAELDRRANQLALFLRRLGVRAEVRVALCLDRSPDMLIGLLGTLKSGGAYVPLDPTYPPERLAYMLADCQAPVLLTQHHLRAALPATGITVIDIDRDWASIGSEPQQAPATTALPANLAYIVYTSGSTGRPKGARISHRAICNSLLWMQSTYPLAADDAFLQIFSFSFDAAVWEFFGPLIAGARVVLIRPGGHQDSVYLARTIVRQGITTLQLVPSLLNVLLDEPEIVHASSLRHVFCGGEALSINLRQRFFTSMRADLCNLYGPTETSIWGSFFPCARGDQSPTVPIGRPIGNAQIYLIDRHLQLVPVGVPGELLRGGIGLADGYLNRPDLTAEKFIPDPFADQPGMRLYRTGDLARYFPDGVIDYLGRVDHQVKIRGFRIELGEVELMLGSHPAVETSLVVAREDVPGDRRLVAYIVTKPGQTPTVADLRSFMEEALPRYMVPASFVLLESFPLTPNGKIDRAALPAPDTSRPAIGATFVAPTTALEEVLAGVWADILNMDQVGIHDSFFTLGGHSLLATRVISEINDLFQIEIPLRTLFEAPSVATMAEALLSKSPDPERMTHTAELLLRLSSLADDEVEHMLNQTTGLNRAGE